MRLVNNGNADVVTKDNLEAHVQDGVVQLWTDTRTKEVLTWDEVWICRKDVAYDICLQIKRQRKEKR